jgi:hypothetical protein
MNFNEWIEIGLSKGWAVGACYTHDLPITIEEEQAFETGEDPCIPMLRIYEPEE